MLKGAYDLLSKFASFFEQLFINSILNMVLQYNQYNRNFSLYTVILPGILKKKSGQCILTGVTIWSSLIYKLVLLDVRKRGDASTAALYSYIFQNDDDHHTI